MKLIAAVLALSAGAADCEVHDIICSLDQKSYAQPGECDHAKVCPVRLGRGFGCALAPISPAWDKNDQNQRVMYNAAVFRRGVPNPQALVAHIINKYFPPFTGKQFSIEIVPERTTSRASIGEGPDGKLVLQVAGDTFRATPSFLAQSIGHELIHAEQLRRPRKNPPTNFEAAADALLELEAHSWELGKSGLQYKIGNNKFLSCLIPEEHLATQLDLQCREWKARKQVHIVLTSPRKHIYGPRLLEWIADNPFAKEWLAKQEDPAADPGKIPEPCIPKSGKR